MGGKGNPSSAGGGVPLPPKQETNEDAALLLLIPLLRYGFSGLWVMSLASLVADGILTFAAARRCANDSSRHA